MGSPNIGESDIGPTRSKGVIQLNIQGGLLYKNSFPLI
jgi:hypothetical protein